MTALDLLRKYQWRADGYSCIGCRAMHRDGCRPGCDVAAVLAAGIVGPTSLPPGFYLVSSASGTLDSTGGNHSVAVKDLVITKPSGVIPATYVTPLGTAATLRTTPTPPRKRTKPSVP